MAKKKRTNLNIILFLIGLSIFLYPIVGNILNVLKNHREISQYEEVVQETEPGRYDKMFEEAREINKSLPGVPKVYEEDDLFYQKYKYALCLEGGMMGYLVIDKIDVKLAIMQGTSDSVLQDSVGFLEGTHLPTGDLGNSTVLTGHTGLPTADLLTDLDQLEVGDTFKLTILDQSFTYEVFKIQVVLPNEVKTVTPIDDIDMVTLVTCTPYGVNSHRLLVHGKQIVPQEAAGNQLTEEFDLYGWILKIVIIAIILLIVLMLILGCKYKKDQYKRDRYEKFKRDQEQRRLE